MPVKTITKIQLIFVNQYNAIFALIIFKYCYYHLTMILSFNSIGINNIINACRAHDFEE